MSLISLAKKIFPSCFLNKAKILLSFYRLYISRRRGGICEYNNNLSNDNKKIILFYEINGLSYAGTQKNLQILAKYLDKKKYEVFFMYSSKNHSERKGYLENSGIHLIDFDYESVENKLPFYITGMKPHIFDVIKDYNIDLFVTAGSGYPEFPTANIIKLPIIFINVFGSVSVQKNIVKHVCNSSLTANTIRPCITSDKVEVMYVPSEGPSEIPLNRGRNLRIKLGINENEFIFGRIGRPDDNIFDPIGINAFKEVVKKYSNAHYLIVAPSPKLEQIVREENIPNVHFLPLIAEEKDVWAFHNAIDVLGHFRKDGETCGLNIAESMLCGKPIISHKSVVWNAHLEYLDNSFSRVAKIDDLNQYAEFMKEFIEAKNNGKIVEMGKHAKEKGDELFIIQNNMGKFEKWIDEALN